MTTTFGDRRSPRQPDELGRLGMLWRVVVRHRWLFAADTLLSVAFYFFMLVPGMALREFFNAVESPDRTVRMLLSALGAFVAFKTANAMTGTLRMTTDTVFQFRVYTRVRTALVTRLLSRPGALPLPCPTGDALSRLRDDAIEVSEVLGKRGLLNFVPSLIAAVGALAVMLTVSARATLLAVVPTLGVSVVTFLASKQARRLRAQNRQAAGDVAALIREVFAGVEALKLARAAPRVASRVVAANRIRQRAAVRDGAFLGLLYSAQGSVVAIGTGLIMIVAAGSMRTGSFHVGDLALFAYNLTVLGSCVLNGGQFVSRYQRLEASRQRLAGLAPSGRDADALDPPDEGEAPRPGLLARPLAQAGPLRTLAVREVDYDHPDGTPGLRGIDLTIRRGQVVAVAGRIGSGKTTLLRVLLGLLPRTAGEIHWNDKALPPDCSLQPPHAAYTPQAPRLLSESVRENVLLGLPDDDRLAAALRASTLDTDVARFADGVDTLVGPRGHRLSGGQLHRLAAARMLARDAELLVIDDLSAALDVRTERLLWQRLIDDGSGRTVLVVSNRRGVLRRADHVVVMSGGRISRQGPLDAVLDASAELRAIWSEQSATGTEPAEPEPHPAPVRPRRP